MKTLITLLFFLSLFIYCMESTEDSSLSGQAGKADGVMTCPSTGVLCTMECPADTGKMKGGIPCKRGTFNTATCACEKNCEEDADCVFGEVCEETEAGIFCVSGCREDADCSDNQNCEEVKCKKAPCLNQCIAEGKTKCAEDSDCDSDEVCEETKEGMTCVGGCREDGDCRANQICEKVKCKKAPCPRQCT